MVLVRAGLGSMIAYGTGQQYGTNMEQVSYVHVRECDTSLIVYGRIWSLYVHMYVCSIIIVVPVRSGTV